jgi:hypothetical protein
VIYLLVVCAISVVSVLLLPGKVGRPEPVGTVQRQPEPGKSATAV